MGMKGVDTLPALHQLPQIWSKEQQKKTIKNKHGQQRLGLEGFFHAIVCNGMLFYDNVIYNYECLTKLSFIKPHQSIRPGYFVQLKPVCSVFCVIVMLGKDECKIIKSKIDLQIPFHNCLQYCGINQYSSSGLFQIFFRLLPKCVLVNTII